MIGQGPLAYDDDSLQACEAENPECFQNPLFSKNSLNQGHRHFSPILKIAYNLDQLTPEDDC